MAPSATLSVFMLSLIVVIDNQHCLCCYVTVIVVSVVRMNGVMLFAIRLSVLTPYAIKSFLKLQSPEASSCLAPALGVIKCTIVVDVNLIKVCCST